MPGAASRSRQEAKAPARRSTKAAGAASTTRAGTSATRTRTARSGQAPSTDAAIVAPRRTAKKGKPDARRETPESGSTPGVVAAVERDLALIRKLSPELADSALAASALAMAREIDTPHNSATSKSMCAKALLDALALIRDLSPPTEEGDTLDELASRRALRLTGRSAT